MYRAFMIISVLFLLSSCQNENTPESNTETNQPETEVSTNQSPSKTHYEASHEAPYCKLWVVKQAVNVDNQENYKGRWFNLKKDGTFESGQWGDTTNGGSWSIEKESNIISLVYNTPDVIPANWKIQGAGGGGRILFKGNVPGNERGIQMMLEPETVLPNQ